MTSLVAQYSSSIAFYEAVTSQFQSMLSLLLGQETLHIHSISGRTKDSQSLRGKIARHKNKYKQLTDITDLCGFRIVTYYEDEVDKIAALLRRYFSIDEENSVDKRKKLAADEFGYTSLHLIVNLPVNAKGICLSTRDKICKVEIQIRSILQHAWAEIEHDLEYKNPQGTSADIRRRFSRMAGLLEVADHEFTAIRDTISEPAADIRNVPAVAQAPEPVSKYSDVRESNFHTLREFLREFPNMGWAAFVTLLFFVIAYFCDFWFGTKITHLAMAFSTLLVMS